MATAPRGSAVQRPNSSRVVKLQYGANCLVNFCFLASNSVFESLGYPSQLSLESLKCPCFFLHSLVQFVLCKLYGIVWNCMDMYCFFKNPSMLFGLLHRNSHGHDLKISEVKLHTNRQNVQSVAMKGSLPSLGFDAWSFSNEWLGTNGFVNRAPVPQNHMSCHSLLMFIIISVHKNVLFQGIWTQPKPNISKSFPPKQPSQGPISTSGAEGLYLGLYTTFPPKCSMVHVGPAHQQGIAPRKLIRGRFSLFSLQPASSNLKRHSTRQSFIVMTQLIYVVVFFLVQLFLISAAWELGPLPTLGSCHKQSQLQ